MEPLLKPGERPSCKTCGTDLVGGGRQALVFIDDPSVPDGIYCTACDPREDS